MGVAIITSCKKDSQINTSEGFNDFDYPEKIDDRLKFESLDHLQHFYNFLAERAETATDLDSALYQFEMAIGHNSIRSIVNSENNQSIENNSSSRNPENIEENWLIDDVRMSLLNEHYEIQVDNKLYTYSSPNVVFEYSATNIEIRDALRGVEKGDDRRLEYGVISDPDVKIISPKYPPGWTAGTPEDEDDDDIEKLLGCQIEFQGLPILLGFSCDPGRIELAGGFKRSDPDFNDGETAFNEPGDATIDWGDGQVEDYLDISEFSGISHDYENEGTYEVNVVYNIEAGCPDEDTNEIEAETFEETFGEVTIVFAECSSGSQHICEYVTDGDYRLLAELWFKKDLFGKHQVAKTTSQQWRKPWINPLNIWGYEWRNTRANICARVDYGFRDKTNCAEYLPCDGLFSGVALGSETDQKNNAKTVRAGKTYGCNASDNISIVDDEVKGFMYITIDGTYIEKNLELSVCE